MLIFRSFQSKISILLGLILITLSILENVNSITIILELIGIFIISRNIDCLIYGQCYNASWIALLIPFCAVVIAILYKISYFDKYNDFIYKTKF